MKRMLSAATSLLLAASASAQVPASAAAKIGTAAAVAGSVKAVAEGAAVGRVISSGKPLFLNDHVTTSAAGRLQVLLLDETIFTLGPNSDMVLDDFVYDPKSGSGKVDAAISKGTFRFVTGRIAQKDPSKLKIKVAVGTIGVRGSIGVGETGPGGTTIINAGARDADNHDDAAGIYAQSGGKTVNLPQPGVGTRITPDGRVADASFMTGELNRIMGTLQAQVGQAAGKGGAPAGASRRSATDSSGRSTAEGGLHASVSGETALLFNSADVATAQSIQSQTESGVTGVPDGLTTWSQLVGLTGTGTYNGTGSYSGTGGSGSATLAMDVNFGARTLGGGGSTLTLTGSFPDTASIQSINYANLSGNALVTPVLSGSKTYTSTSLSLQNEGGIPAKTATLSFTVSTGAGPTSSGSVTGTR
ncbi:MAG TPA: FecR domain-containing protein [Elusimicrobiota bacterium]|nr:FecR domain-containing protein [Elusimicrobiota bacterium]